MPILNTNLMAGLLFVQIKQTVLRFGRRIPLYTFPRFTILFYMYVIMACIQISFGAIC